MRSCDKAYHMTCFRCGICRRLLVAGDEYAMDVERGILCRRDHERVWKEDKKAFVVTKGINDASDCKMVSGEMERERLMEWRGVDGRIFNNELTSKTQDYPENMKDLADNPLKNLEARIKKITPNTAQSCKGLIDFKNSTEIIMNKKEKKTKNKIIETKKINLQEDNGESIDEEEEEEDEDSVDNDDDHKVFLRIKKSGTTNESNDEIKQTDIKILDNNSNNTIDNINDNNNNGDSSLVDNNVNNNDNNDDEMITDDLVGESNKKNNKNNNKNNNNNTTDIYNDNPNTNMKGIDWKEEDFKKKVVPTRDDELKIFFHKSEHKRHSSNKFKVSFFLYSFIFLSNH